MGRDSATSKKIPGGKKRKATKSQPEAESENSSVENDLEAPKMKKRKSDLDPATTSSANGKAIAYEDGEGQSYVSLGNHRRATVRTFKGKHMVDIREFYEDKDEKERPGKKGISLSVENWNALKGNMDLIDEFISKLS